MPSSRLMAPVTLLTLLGSAPASAGLSSFECQSRAVEISACWPADIVVADLDRDGIPDLVVANGFLQQPLKVLRGLGNGEFAPATSWGARSSADRVILADFDGDGYPDALIANSYVISFLHGNGDGTFGAQRDISSYATGGFAVGDLDGDGNLDVTFATGRYGIGILLGNGDGTFKPEVDYRMFQFPQTCYDLAIGDFNMDGLPDLVASVAPEEDQWYYGHDHLQLLIGRGDGTFAVGDSFPTGAGCRRLSVADVNHDGKPDVVVANRMDGSISVFLGRGDGTFAPKVDYPVAWRPYATAVADLNGDGVPDVAVADSSATVSVLLGNGNGTFGPATRFHSGEDSRGIAIADLDKDGKADLVVANYESHTLSVLHGTRSGIYRPETDFTAGYQPWALRQADLNGDGRPDIVVGNYAGTLSVLLGGRDSTFHFIGSFAARGLNDLAISDLNGDGVPEVIVSLGAKYDSIGILRSNGDGTLRFDHREATGRQPMGVAIADVNLDGRQDIISANYIDQSISVLLGNGDLTFQPRRDTSWGQPTFLDNAPTCLVAGDIDGDGAPDVVVCSQVGATVLKGDGQGAFTIGQSVAIGGATSLALGDLNGDGILDLVGGNGYVALGNGDGTFQTPFAVSPGGSMTAIADMDLDGKPDLVSSVWWHNTVAVNRGNGDGTFAPAEEYGTGRAPVALVVTDFDQDGRPDIITADYRQDAVTALRNNGAILPGDVVRPHPVHVSMRVASPMPARDHLTVALELPKPALVRAEIFDISGRRTRILERGRSQLAGIQSIGWDLRDDAGTGVPNGVYFVRVLVDRQPLTARVVVLSR